MMPMGREALLDVAYFGEHEVVDLCGVRVKEAGFDI